MHLSNLFLCTFIQFTTSFKPEVLKLNKSGQCVIDSMDMDCSPWILESLGIKGAQDIVAKTALFVQTQITKTTKVMKL